MSKSTDLKSTSTDYASVILARYKFRDYHKPFAPLEEIAANPELYGYHFPPRESKAKQRLFIESDKKICAAILANRGGKTEAGAVKFINACLKQKNGGRAWILSPSFDSQKSGVQEKLLEYLKPSHIESKQFAVGSALKQIVLTNGVIIEFKTYEQGREKLQSAKLFIAWFDEEPKDEAVFNEVYTRTLDLKGQIILTFTPLNGLTWSHKKIFNSTRKDILVVNWGMADNPFIALEEIEQLKQQLSHKQAQMRLYGKYMGSEGAVYQVFDRNTHVQPSIFDMEMPVEVSIDWGVVVAAVGFFQHKKILKKGKMVDNYYLIDAMELTNVGYGTVMQSVFKRASEKRYFIPEDGWICDPAGRQRSQATKTGSSLLTRIKEEYGVEFKYLKKLGIEESIEIVSSLMMNEVGEARFFIQEGIQLNDKGDTPEMRIEGYVRDEDTKKPIDDEINTHLNDLIRYYCANKLRKNRIQWEQR